MIAGRWLAHYLSLALWFSSMRNKDLSLKTYSIRPVAGEAVLLTRIQEFGHFQ